MMKNARNMIVLATRRLVQGAGSRVSPTLMIFSPIFPMFLAGVVVPYSTIFSAVEAEDAVAEKEVREHRAVI